jgi:hypothetical protein
VRGSSRTRSLSTNRPAWTPAAGLGSCPTKNADGLSARFARRRMRPTPPARRPPACAARAARIDRGYRKTIRSARRCAMPAASGRANPNVFRKAIAERSSPFGIEGLAAGNSLRWLRLRRLFLGLIVGQRRQFLAVELDHRVGRELPVEPEFLHVLRPHPAAAVHL